MPQKINYLWGSYTDSADVITDVIRISDTDADGVTKLSTYEAIQDDSDVLEDDEQTKECATKTYSLYMILKFLQRRRNQIRT